MATPSTLIMKLFYMVWHPQSIPKFPCSILLFSSSSLPNYTCSLSFLVYSTLVPWVCSCSSLSSTFSAWIILWITLVFGDKLFRVLVLSSSLCCFCSYSCIFVLHLDPKTCLILWIKFVYSGEHLWVSYLCCKF